MAAKSAAVGVAPAVQSARTSMERSPTLTLTLTLTLALTLASVAKAGEQCLGAGRERYLVDETLIVVANPNGFEHQSRLAWCAPLVRRPGILFDYTQLEVGLLNYVSPVYVHQGAYAAVTPLSFLVLRADVAALAMWPLPGFDGAGYFALDGYGADFRDPALPQARARGATGLNATLTAQLQGALPLGRRAQLVAVDTFSADAWSVGDAPYYFNPRRDLVLARADWLVKNVAMLVVEVRATERLALRAGAADDVSYVPASGYLAHQVGFFTSLLYRRDGAPRDIEAFVRLSEYTAHAFREGLALLAGVSAAWSWPAK